VGIPKRSEFFGTKLVAMSAIVRTKQKRHKSWDLKLHVEGKTQTGALGRQRCRGKNCAPSASHLFERVAQNHRIRMGIEERKQTVEKECGGRKKSELNRRIVGVTPQGRSGWGGRDAKPPRSEAPGGGPR